MLLAVRKVLRFCAYKNYDSSNYGTMKLLYMGTWIVAVGAVSCWHAAAIRLPAALGIQIGATCQEQHLVALLVRGRA